MIILCHGTDAFRIRAAADSEARMTGVVAVRLRLSDPGARTELERILKYPSFLQEHRTVILSDALVDDTLPALLEDAGVSALSDTTVIACVAVPAKPPADTRARLTELIRISIRVHECHAPAGAAWSSWINEYCAANGWRIEPAALPKLLERTGTDSWSTAMELEKLAAYGSGVITADAVGFLTPDPAVQDQWELSNALAAHDKRRALKAFFERVGEGTSEPMLLGGLASSVRTLLMIRDLSDRGEKPTAIAAKTGLHPFVVSKSMPGARAYELSALKRALGELADLDRASKNGMADATDGMFGILLSLA